MKSERRGIHRIAELANVSIGTVDLTPLFGYFWMPMNQPVHPRWGWQEAPCGRPGAGDDSGSDALDSKILLTVF